MIRRRELLHGLTLAPGVASLPAAAAIQGQTDEAMAQAHAALREDPGRWASAAAAADEGVEDLVVVGSGISGLAGAWLWRQQAGAGRRILVLDALDEPGGHARRNEFVARNGQRLIGYGGSQSLDSPSLFSPAVRHVLAGVGVRPDKLEQAFDRGWARRHRLGGRIHCFADGRTVRQRAAEPTAQWLARSPAGRAAVAAWSRLTAPLDPWPGLGAQPRRSRLADLVYAEYLQSSGRLGPPGEAGSDTLRAWLRWQPAAYFGVGIDAVGALDAWAAGLPGFEGLALGRAPEARHGPSARLLATSEDDYVYHFPDGNHGLVRALLRDLVPPAVPGSGMASLAGSVLVDSMLDRPGAPLRIRQRATVVHLAHEGLPTDRDRLVSLRYLDARGELREVRAHQVLLACWHRVIARLAAAELPAAQRAALQDQVKVPLLYASVLLNNWRAWQRAGVAALAVADGFWHEAALDFPVSLGEVRFPQRPDQPILCHLGKVVVPGDGGAPRAQAAAGRALLAGWSYAQIEREVIQLLQTALGPYGFDAARDIEAITVNRWAHGYALEYMRPWDAFWPDGPLPCETARRGWGRVAIANSDAGAYAYAHSAIDQAARAVSELLPQARLPAWARFPGP